jgi:uncharacterized membrane protein YdjX (TVP38/TMEM64 family)
MLLLALLVLIGGVSCLQSLAARSTPASNTARATAAARTASLGLCRGSLALHATRSPVSRDPNDVWSSRRKISRFLLTSIAKDYRQQRSEDELELQEEEEEEEVEEEVEEEGEEEKEKKKSGLSEGALLATFMVTGGALALRLGGRGAFVSMLGLDFISDSNLKTQIESFVASFQALEPAQAVGSFFLAWFASKLFMVDAFTIVLAVSSGVLFGGLLQGTVLSVACSSLASLLLFTATRYKFKDEAQEQIAKRPALKAIDRATRQNGLKTVFTLRLSPLLPVPVAAYNYIYALTSVSALDFVLGISAGSVKPYLLDCYLGLFGQSVLQNPTGTGEGSTSDMVLLLVVGVVVLVGTFATQLVADTWSEIQSEMQEIQAQKEAQRLEVDGALGSEGGNSVNSSGSSGSSGSSSGGDLDLFTMLGIVDGDLPKPVEKVKRELSGAWGRVDKVIEDEWRLLLDAGEDEEDGEGGGEGGVGGVGGGGRRRKGVRCPSSRGCQWWSR